MNKIKTIKPLILKTDLRRLERAKNSIIRISMLAFLPTILAFIYYAFIASDFYESEAQFKVFVKNEKSSNNDLTPEAYILSREALSRLDKELNFIATYQSKEIDFLNRLSAIASFEDAYRYYLNIIKISFDSTSGVMTLKIKAPTAYKAKIYADALLKYSDEVILKITEKLKNEQLNFAKQELSNAENRLALAKYTLIKLEESKENTEEQISLIEKALTEKAFAEEAYRSAMSFLANTRIELMKQYHYLAVIVHPNKPSSAIYPNTLTGTLTVFSLAMALYGIFCLLTLIVKEHARI